MKVKEEREKAGLKLNIQKTKIMASTPITSWQIDGEKVETVDRLYFGGLQNHHGCDCNHEIKRHLLLVITNLDSELKSRDITLPTKVHVVKALVFPIVTHTQLWKLDNKKGLALKNWCFQTVVLEKTVQSPLRQQGDQISQS